MLAVIFEKSELKDVMIVLTKNLKGTQGINMRHIHCKNAGENEAFHKQCKQEGMGINFAYTMLSVPQQNSIIEHRFEMQYNRVHVMLIREIFPFLKNDQ